MKITKLSKMKITKLSKIVIAIVVAAILYFGIEVLFSKININVSNSHPGTIFWKTNNTPKIGDYVYFEFEHKLLPKTVKYLSKQLVCKDGDNLQIDNNYITCNNKKYKIKRRAKTGSGKRINQFYYNGVIPKNKAIVWGENLESFDSRYWGFIGYSKLQKMIMIF